MAICNLRARVAILWLVLTLLIIGIVVWAISAEVMMGAMRESVRKNSEISTLRLDQNSDTSDDFSIYRINNKVGHSIKSGLRHSETALIREVDKQGDKRVANNRHKSGDDFYSYDQRSDEIYNTDGEEEEEEETEATHESIKVKDKKTSSTKRPLLVNFDLDKLKKGLTGAQVTQILERLMSQTKGKERTAENVAPTQLSTKKPKTSKTSTKLSSKSQKYSKSSKTTTTSTTTTTSKPTTTRTTLKPFNRSRIQSLSLKLLNSAVTTTKPKRTNFKVSTIKIRRTTTTTPPTTTTIRTTTTKKPIPTTKSRIRSRKTSLKGSVAKYTTTTPTTTEASKSAELELLKSKIRQKELEFILNKVESLEKQQKRFLKQSNQDLLMEGSFRDSSVAKPNYEVISFRKKQPEFSPSYSSKHNYDIQDIKQHSSHQSNGWQPTINSPPAMHMPPPPPPPPPVPNGPPPHPHHSPPPPPQNDVFHNPENFHQMQSQPHMVPPPPSQPYPEAQGMPHFSGNHMLEPNMNPHPNNGHMKENFFHGVLPIPNRPMNSGGGDPHMVQESHPIQEYQIKQRGHHVKKTEKPGIQLSFGGGPMGGGGQLKTSPMGIFKTLLLPLLPKPRMNLNGKVVFGVVLENGVGFGKKPKIVAQHFSTGRI